MDDEEIKKLWKMLWIESREIGSKQTPLEADQQASIRLYRMAQEQARADEREKCNWAHNEAYAKGKAE